MEQNKFYAKTLSAIAFFICFIIYGTMAFWNSKQIDFYTCIFLFKNVIPYSLVVAFCGYFVGKIIDNSGSKKRR